MSIILGAINFLAEAARKNATFLRPAAPSNIPGARQTRSTLAENCASPAAGLRVQVYLPALCPQEFGALLVQARMHRLPEKAIRSLHPPAGLRFLSRTRQSPVCPRHVPPKPPWADLRDGWEVSERPPARNTEPDRSQAQ